MKYISIITVLFLLVGCDPQQPRPIEPDHTGPVPVVDTDLCDEAEDNVEKLQCKDRAGDPMWVNKNGERFAETCRRAQEEGGIFLNPRCVSEATSCSEVKSCPADL